MLSDLQREMLKAEQFYVDGWMSARGREAVSLLKKQGFIETTWVSDEQYTQVQCSITPAGRAALQDMEEAMTPEERAKQFCGNQPGAFVAAIAELIREAEAAARAEGRQEGLREGAKLVRNGDFLPAPYAPHPYEQETARKIADAIEQRAKEKQHDTE